MTEDTELLDRYVRQSDDGAFRELVERHVSLVHSAAMRQVNGDAHLAADVTQHVFTDLARKARAVATHPVLSAWLLTSTRFAASHLVRTEQRRRTREQEAQGMYDNQESSPSEWDRIRPVIDEVLADLSATDREAVMLRYFESRDYAAIGRRLNVSDNTARMRVERALEKVRTALARRGITSTAGALGIALADHAVLAAPVGLAAKVAGVALAEAVGASSVAFFMGMTKLQFGITAAIVAAGSVGLVAQSKSNASLRAEVAALGQQTQAVAQVRAENERLKATAAEASALRAEDAEWARLREETAALKAKLVADAAKQPNAKDRLPVLKTPPTRVAYPEALQRAGTSGDAVVDFIVDAKGGVQNAHVIRTTHPGFEAPALEAVKQCVFDSGVKGGRPVNTHMQMKVAFNAANGETSVEQPEPVSASVPKFL